MSTCLATPTGKKGVYHVTTVFSSIVGLIVTDTYAPTRKNTIILSSSDAWTYNRDTGGLLVKTPIDNDKKRIGVRGVRALPWAWRTIETPQESSVCVMFGSKKGVKGVDFEVNKEKRLIRVFDKLRCSNGLPIRVSWKSLPDPQKPKANRTYRIGWPPSRLKQPKQRNRRHFFKLNPGPTPRLFNLLRPFTDDLEVGFADLSSRTRRTLFIRGKDYLYDDKSGSIIFLNDDYMGKQNQSLHVYGTLRARNVFLFHRRLAKRNIHIYVNKRLLKEGYDYQLDYSRGILTIKDKGIFADGARYSITLGDFVITNGGN